jgi:ParB family transcriptional regulator, chromosome partitioning protein
MMDPKRRALGRGLDALLPSAPQAPAAYGDNSVFACAIEKLVAQKGQPRQHFAKDKLDELAASIKEHGLIEPIVVRRVSGQDKLEIIAGERRWRASQKAGLKEVLVVVKDVTPKAAFELALIENVQREDLNPVELAEALDRLTREHGYTQESLAERLGKDRTTIANSLRLLKLPPSVRSRVISGELTEGHARALLGAPDPAKIEELAEKVVRGRMSVRAAEALVRAAKAKSAERAQGPEKTAPGKSAAVRDLEQRLTRTAGTKVVVRPVTTKAKGESKGEPNKGEIAIPYEDLDHLDRILARVFKMT